MANDMLYPAVFSGDFERVSSLLSNIGDEGADIDVNMKAGKAQLAPLHHAAKKNHVGITDLLLAHPNIDVNAQDRSLRTPLHLACRKGYTQIVAKLLQCSEAIDVNAKAKGDITPLHLAAYCGNDEVVELLLEHRLIDLDARTADERFTALHMAACSGYDSIVRMILDAHRRHKIEEQLRPIINAEDRLGRTPLHYAACEQRLDVVRELFLSTSLHVNTGDRDSFTALHLAARKGHVAMVQLLLGHGELDPNVGAKSNQETQKLAKTVQDNAVWGELPRPRLTDYIFSEVCSKMTALHFAVEFAVEAREEEDQKEVALALVNALLAHPNIDVTLENSKRQSAVDLSVQMKLDYLLVTLIPRTNDVCNVCGKLLKHILPKKSYEPLVRLIVKEIHDHLDGLELKIGTGKKFDVTLIHKVAFAGYDKLLDILLSIPELALEINAEDSDKQTPLHYAAIGGHTSVVKVLISKPALRANQEDRYNITALQIAIQSARKDIEKLLLERLDVKDWVDRLYRDRQVYVDAANAILVGAALIASVTYAGWLQPPLGYTPYYEFPVPDPAPPDTYQVYASVQQHASTRVFWVCNSLSFFSAIATVIAGAGAVLPMLDVFIGEEVRVVRRYLVLTSILLVFAVVFVLGAFAAAGFASLPPIFSLQVNMIATSVIGILLCISILVWFLRRLYRLRPSWWRNIEESFFPRRALSRHKTPADFF
ncbi:hypothetical protein MPTK1_6g08760 [Marchantia polymorpha subsp. ruderalis]|uniref:PGG domain-containing protein n=4 Tax=Marchantia polymorpha TaxID=3197 RepID=A0AAF6BQ03_MARPO|nr:hypothetical protein MARPO_0060s0045 [Marchantia polymorpha]BBN14087.1 hypothetical protein Mp_6g08760 [Marchantia polymorpha subsp. ruderalis]|eukprot:PTQ36957.1 hypothetical protein MARPO_0060s0045 [Marchantia polymorpha]